jgi:hypothetical protein
MLARELLKEGLRSQVRTGAAYCPRRIGGAFLCRCPACQHSASAAVFAAAIITHAVLAHPGMLLVFIHAP